MKRALLFATVFCGLAGTLIMTEGRAYAMRVYGVPCGQASGFAGLLQKTHFLPSSGCTLKTGGGCANPGTACSFKNPVSGGASNGHCTTSGTSCVCL
jgi:hypothetical protein